MRGFVNVSRRPGEFCGNFPVWRIGYRRQCQCRRRVDVCCPDGDRGSGFRRIGDHGVHVG